MGVRFSWNDKANNSRNTVSFGGAQKLINLALKDWWALSPNSSTSNCQYLHAPFDQIVYTTVRRTLGDLPSLKGARNTVKSYIYNLNQNDYFTYQNNIESMSMMLSSALKIKKLCRLEIDQLLWKWV